MEEHGNGFINSIIQVKPLFLMYNCYLLNFILYLLCSLRYYSIDKDDLYIVNEK
jgi:hypothetical protein